MIRIKRLITFVQLDNDSGSATAVGHAVGRRGHVWPSVRCIHIKPIKPFSNGQIDQIKILNLLDIATINFCLKSEMEYVETIENLKMVLEERERNIELAARIGQSLLERNKELQNRIEILEHSQYESRLEISRLKEEANQLKHSLQIKDEIISEIEDERMCQKEAEISSSISIENDRLKVEIRQLENQLKDTENRWEISTANQREEFDLELMRKEKQLQALKEDLIQKGNDIQELYSENSKLTSRIFHLEREIRQKDIKIIHGKLIFR